METVIGFFVVEFLRRHSPLVIVMLVAIASTGLMVMTKHSFFVSVAGNMWGIAVLLVALDVTPRDAREKQEKA